MNAEALPPVALHYFYDEPLPNRFAASIQILRTGAELAARGTPFVYECGRLAGAPLSILAEYGLPETTGLELSPFFGGPTRPAAARAALLRWRFDGLVRAARRRRGATVFMTRGETAFALLPMIERLDRLGPGRPLFVYESHRPCHLRAVEKRLGRSARDEDLDDPSARRIVALERRAIAAADGLVFLTEAAADAAVAPSSAPRLTLPSGVDLPSAQSAPRQADVDVVYAGKLELRKGLWDLLAAIARLPGRTLAVAGGPDEAVERARAEARALGVADRVTFVGWLPPARVNAFLSRGRIGVCPLRAGADSVSDRFTSPMKLLQMMALGLPVVATDLGPVCRIATDGRDALLAPANDPDALAAAMAQLLENPRLAGRLGAAARARVTDFIWPARGARLQAFLADLVSHRSLGSSDLTPGRAGDPLAGEDLVGWRRSEGSATCLRVIGGRAYRRRIPLQMSDSLGLLLGGRVKC